jgi:adenylate cyclase
MQVWLNAPDGKRIPLDGVVRIGRSATNLIVVADERVSRYHAVIHPQDDGEFWLIDLGSINGTYLNERRVVLPARLQENDAIQFGAAVYTYQTASGMSTAIGLDFMLEKPTTPVIQTRSCWLVLADVEGFSLLSEQVPPDELARLVSQWLQKCKKIIDSHGGAINKYTGDGFLAYWTDKGEPTALKVCAASKLLVAMQADMKMKFRLVAHWTEVSMGGASAAGEESLLGRGVNYLFRAEKLAASLAASRMLTVEAAERWPEKEGMVALGEHAMRDFPVPRAFYQFPAGG